MPHRKNEDIVTMLYVIPFTATSDHVNKLDLSACAVDISAGAVAACLNYGV